MKTILGLTAVCALLAVAGCGGAAELDSDEVQTVTVAKSAVANAVQDGSLAPGDGKKLEDLMILCREKPLAESDGMSMREVLDDLASRLSKSDPGWSSKLESLAAYGCD